MADNINPPPFLNVAQPKTCGWAIASFVFGIVGVFTFGVAAPLGFIFGIFALYKIKKSHGMLWDEGRYARIGTIMSGVLLLPFAIYIAVILPATIRRAEQGMSMKNERLLGQAILSYSEGHSDRFPPAASWCDAIQSQTGIVSKATFKNPFIGSDKKCGFAFNSKLGSMEQGKVDPDTVMLFESDAGWNANGGRELMFMHRLGGGGKGFFVTFADGSVEAIPQSKLDTLRWDPKLPWDP